MCELATRPFDNGVEIPPQFRRVRVSLVIGHIFFDGLALCMGSPKKHSLQILLLVPVLRKKRRFLPVSIFVGSIYAASFLS